MWLFIPGLSSDDSGCIDMDGIWLQDSHNPRIEAIWMVPDRPELSMCEKNVLFESETIIAKKPCIVEARENKSIETAAICPTEWPTRKVRSRGQAEE